MRRILSRFETHSRRWAIAVLALLIVGSVLFIRSDASNVKQVDEIASGDSRQGNQRRDGCPSCPPPSGKRIYAPAIELREAERCEIVLNSRSANPIEVTPIFYTVNGDAVVMNPVHLQPAEIRFIPVESLMPEAMRGRQRWSGIALSSYWQRPGSVGADYLSRRGRRQRGRDFQTFWKNRVQTRARRFGGCRRRALRSSP